MDVPFVVQGAIVHCDCGSLRDTIQLQTAENRSKMGNDKYMLARDTSTSNFSGDFGTCSSAYHEGSCSPSFVDKWERVHDTMLYGDSNGTLHLQEYYQKLDEFRDKINEYYEKIAKVYKSVSRWVVSNHEQNFRNNTEEFGTGLEERDLTMESFVEARQDLNFLSEQIDTLITYTKYTFWQKTLGIDKLKNDPKTELYALETELEDLQEEIDNELKPILERFSQSLDTYEPHNPLLKKSVLVCTHGGVIYIDTTGQDPNPLTAMDDSTEGITYFDPYAFNEYDAAKGKSEKRFIDGSTVKEGPKTSLIRDELGAQRSYCSFLGFDFSGYCTAEFKGTNSSYMPKEIIDFMNKKVLMIPVVPLQKSDNFAPYMEYNDTYNEEQGRKVVTYVEDPASGDMLPSAQIYNEGAHIVGCLDATGYYPYSDEPSNGTHADVVALIARTTKNKPKLKLISINGHGNSESMSWTQAVSADNYLAMKDNSAKGRVRNIEKLTDVLKGIPTLKYLAVLACHPAQGATNLCSELSALLDGVGVVGGEGYVAFQHVQTTAYDTNYIYGAEVAVYESEQSTVATKKTTRYGGVEYEEWYRECKGFVVYYKNFESEDNLSSTATLPLHVPTLQNSNLLVSDSANNQYRRKSTLEGILTAADDYMKNPETP